MQTRKTNELAEHFINAPEMILTNEFKFNIENTKLLNLGLNIIIILLISIAINSKM